MKSHIVIGMGRFGSRVARELSQMGCEVLAMDVRPDMVQQVANDVTHAVVGDSQDKEVLRSLDAGSFDCAVVAIGGDLAASVLTLMNLKELGSPKIICKAHDHTHQRVLEKLGADRVVIPEHEQAVRLARSMASTNVLDYIELSSAYGIIEVPTPKAWHNRTLKDLNVRASLGVTLIAVKRGKHTHVSPAANFVLRPGDIPVVLGDSNALEAVQKL